jgi:VWFA-related protein
MKKLIPFLIVFILASYGYAQESPIPQSTPVSPITLLPTPVPPPPTGVENDIVKITTTLVQLDVTVTDKSGRAITDIRPDEIEVYENGQKQDISYFSFISIARKPAAETDRKKEDKTAVPVPARTLRPEQVKRTIALVVDDLTLSFESANRVRNALKKFVDEQMQDGDLVGIIRTGAGMGALQQFTSDKRQLYAAIEKVRWNGSARGRFGSFDAVEPTNAERRRAMGDAEVHVDDIKEEKEFNNSSREFRDSVFTTGTLGALKFIVGGMKELPGRKSVVLFSDGFKLFNSVEQGASEAGRLMDFMKELIAEANRAAVVFYTIDARGLETTSLTAADSPIFDPFPVADVSGSKVVGNPASDLSRSISDRSGELFETQQGLVYLAKQTGGFPIINQNDLSGGVNKILEDQSYYLVAYQPDAETFDPNVRRFNKIEIKIKRDGAKVRYRSGFFTSRNTDEQTAFNLNQGSLLMKALVSPFAVNGIDVKLNALFGFSKKRGYYVHSFLHIDANDLQFKKLPNGEYRTVFDILAISYGDNGAPVDKNNVTATLSVKEETYRKFLDQGFAYSFVFPVKKPGAYQMRVALVEHGTNKMGSANQFVEIPNLKKEGLTLSGVVLENMTITQWEQFSSSQVLDNMVGQTDPIEDTSKRRFKRGTVLRFGVEVYNSKLRPEQMKVNLQARLYREGQLVYQSKEVPIGESTERFEESAVFTDAVMLGKQLQPGDYIVQVVAIESVGKKKIATQWVQFEVVE